MKNWLMKITNSLESRNTTL